MNRMIAAAAMVLAASLPAEAADLTPADVAQFIAAWPVAAERLAQADDQFDPALTNALEQQLQDMATSDSNDSVLDHVVTPLGYADFEGFAAMSARILTAAKWAKDPPDEADLQAAIDAVKADADRTAQDKAALAASLKEAYGRALAAKPAAADVETVRSQVAAIDKAIGVEP